MSFISGQTTNNLEVNKTLSQIESFQTALVTSKDIQRSINSRFELLDNYLEPYKKRLGSINKQLGKARVAFGDYSNKIREVKESFRSPLAFQQKALELLQTNNQFKSFVQRNSFLSDLFPGRSVPVNSDQSIGMMSRVGINNKIADQFSITPENASAISQKFSSVAQRKNSTLDVPVMKSNVVSTLDADVKRHEFGISIQTTRSSSVIPSFADLALFGGWNVNKKITIGVGVSYKIGLGTGINNIRLSHQGVGLRSYADLKWKRSVFLSGGFEMNYLKPFDELATLKSFHNWTSSGLIGLTKKIDFHTGIIKGMRIQLFWDFLASSKPAQAQPVLFRIGYQF